MVDVVESECGIRYFVEWMVNVLCRVGAYGPSPRAGQRLPTQWYTKDGFSDMSLEGDFKRSVKLPFLYSNGCCLRAKKKKKRTQ